MRGVLTLNLGQILLEDRDYENFGEMEIEPSLVYVGRSVKANPNVVLCPAISSSSNFIKTWVEKVANNNKLRKFIDGKCESSPMDDDELHTVMKYQNLKVMMWKSIRKPVNVGQIVKVMENVAGEHQFDDNSCQLTTYRR